MRMPYGALTEIVLGVLGERFDWITAMEVYRAVLASPRFAMLPPGVDTTAATVRVTLLDLRRRKAVQRRGTPSLSEWAALGVPGADQIDHLKRGRNDTGAKEDSHLIAFRTTSAIKRMLERWARITMMPLPTLIRQIAVYEAMRWIVATQNTPVRLVPGVPVFRTTRAPIAPNGAGLEYKIEFMADGEERVWVTDFVENLPPTVAPDGHGFVIDIVGHPVVNLLVRSGGVTWPPAHQLASERNVSGEVMSREVSTSRKVAEVRLDGTLGVRSPGTWRSRKSRSPTTPSAAGSSSSASPPQPPGGTTETSPSPAPPSTPGSTTTTGGG